MTLRDLVPLCFVINLDRRTDRWKDLQAILPQSIWHLSPRRWPAIDGEKVPCPDWYESGSAAWGCGRSHLAILEHAMMNNLEAYLVLEDDCCFCPDFEQRLEQFLSSIPETWEQLYLGGQLLRTFNRIPDKINDHCFRGWDVHRAHSYIVHKRAYSKIYKHLCSHEPKLIIDYRFGELHERGEVEAYVPANWLVGQRVSHSDLMNSERKMDEYWLNPIDVWSSHKVMDLYFKQNPLQESEIASHNPTEISHANGSEAL